MDSRGLILGSAKTSRLGSISFDPLGNRRGGPARATTPCTFPHRKVAVINVKNEPRLEKPSRPRASFVRLEASPRSFGRPHHVQPRLVYL